jgi:flagellar biogenesis protein FliO
MDEIYVNLIKVILLLLGLLGVMALLYRFLGKQKGLLRFSGLKTGGYVKKLETVHMGNRKFLSVVEVKDHILVIGVGQENMVLLAQWPKAEKEE